MGRLRGFLWLIAGIVVAALAGGVAFIALSRAAADRADVQELAPERSVVVAARSVDAYDMLTIEDLEVVEVSVDAVPETALRDIEQAEGKITLVQLYPGEAVLEPRILDPNVTARDGRTALVLAEDEILMAFPAGDLLSQVGVLQAGDRVDFLFTHDLPIDRDTGFLPGLGDSGTVAGESAEEEDSETVTFNLLQNVTIAAVVRQVDEEGEETGSPRALLLTIDPQDALVLKYMKDVGAVVDLVLRGPETEGEFTLDPVDLDYVINGYIQAGEGTP